MLATIRGMTHNKYIGSLIGGIVAPLSDGPVYFDCYPNFSVYTFDETIDQILQLQIQTTGFDMKRREIILPSRPKAVFVILILFGQPSAIPPTETQSRV